MTVTPEYPTDVDLDLEITPVEKHNWKSKASRDRWRPSLRECRDTYPLVEILAVSDDGLDREVTSIDRGQLRDAEVTNLIAEHGLTVTTHHNRAFIATETEIGEEAVDVWRDEDQQRLGELYGYPDCCVDAYAEIEDENEVPIYEIACRSDNAITEDDENQTIRLEDPDPLLNIIWQYLGYQFVSHVPCSFDCEKSIEIATEHGSLYRELGCGDAAEDLWEFLGTPTTWSGYHGLSNIRNGYLIGSTNTPEYWDEKIVIWKEEHAEKLL